MVVLNRIPTTGKCKCGKVGKSAKFQKNYWYGNKVAHKRSHISYFANVNSSLYSWLLAFNDVKADELHAYSICFCCWT